MKKVFAIWIACVLMIGTLALVACGGKNNDQNYRFYGAGDLGEVSVKFGSGKMTVTADTSGLNNVGLSNLNTTLSLCNLKTGEYSYTQDGDDYKVTNSAGKTDVYQSYFAGKYLVSGAFETMEISIKATKGNADFTITSDSVYKETYTFKSDGTYTHESDAFFGSTPETGTYTFEDGLITMFQNETVRRRLFTPGNGVCYTQFLMKK